MNNPDSSEAQRRLDYEASVGPNAGYYLKHFEDFDAGGSKKGWHWPAFFATTCWFIYRKMWLPGLLNFFWPIITLIVGSILMAVLGVTAGIILSLLLLVAPTIVLPIFANAIYWWHIHKRVANLRSDIAASPQMRVARLERDGGTSAGAVGGILGAGLFIYVFILGILAAIAIPAYQDYTLRAQVTEGFNLAGPVKAQVANYWAQHRQWPEQADFGEQMPHGKFVQQVSVASGSVVITYGNEVNPKLSGQRIVLLPGVTSAGGVVWACGNASLPVGAESAGGPSGSDVANKYLPAACRGE